MIEQTRWVVAGIFLLGACHGSRPPIADVQSQSKTRGVPVYEEPGHRLVFQNQYTRVMDVVIPPGEANLFHTHANPLVGAVIQDGRSWTQKLGEPRGPVEVPNSVGTLIENWSASLPYTHRVGNADTVRIHYLVAEWLMSPGDGSAALAETASRHLLKEGQAARAFITRLAASESTEVHTHAAPGLTVYVTAGAISDEGDAAAATGGTGAGAWRWRNAGYKHVLRNTGTTPAQIMEIDWR
ncbi:MAG: hypothetical protein ABIW94_00330 [Gemmatimonadaceae bacterium]